MESFESCIRVDEAQRRGAFNPEGVRPAKISLTVTAAHSTLRGSSLRLWQKFV
jgi:hypothetical protein